MVISRLFTLAGLGALLFVAPVCAEPLVDAAWLGARSCEDGMVVLDLRESARSLERGRVPCAVHAPYGSLEWRVERNGVVGMLPDAEHLAALIGGLGVGNSDHVVVVGPGGSAGAMTLATRVYWTFKAAGHDVVSLLDGGFSIYRAAGGKVEKGELMPPPRASYAVRLRVDLVADAADVATPGVAALIDSRLSDQYAGINRPRIVARGGTLPGAENVPITWLTRPDGRFQPAEVLAAIGENTGLSAKAPLITFCNSGQMASLDWFVAHELLGNEKARLYDGSMIDWAQDEARPVERRIGAD